MMRNQSTNSDLLKKRCFFCKKCTNDPLLGDKYQLENIVCHYHCLILCNNISQNGEDHEGILGFLIEDIRDVRNKNRKEICKYCQKRGAYIYCQKKNCKVVFHLPCGLAKNSSHKFYGDFKSFCGDHHKNQRLPVSLLKDKQVTCIICMDDIYVRRERRSIVWADKCCKRKTLMHRICAQKYANNAGYAVKCPNCSSRVEFVASLLQNGVFCPLREASWEQNGTFNDLYFGNVCCMEECLAATRSFNRPNSLWELTSCSRCEAFHTHRACSGFQLLCDSFLCEPCKAATRHELPPEPNDDNAKPCAVVDCINPNGRYAFSNQGDWREIKCKHCSTFVAHFACCEYNENWFCNG